MHSMKLRHKRKSFMLILFVQLEVLINIYICNCYGTKCCAGAHTIGRASCGSIQERVFNYSGTGKADPSIDGKYLNFLKRKCRWASDLVELDATTPRTFDAVYYANLPKKMGLLSSDEKLYSDPRTAPLVSALAYQPSLFLYQFGVSMAKLGNVQVLTGPHEGEIRTKCNFVNSH